MNHDDVLAALPDRKEEAKNPLRRSPKRWDWRDPPMWTGSGQSGDWSGMEVAGDPNFPREISCVQVFNERKQKSYGSEKIVIVVSN